MTIEQALQEGVSAHRDGRLQDAERYYRAILQSQPKHPDANHNLGVIAVAVNKSNAALPHFMSAIEANPNVQQYWLSYIDALIKDQQIDLAKNVLQQANYHGIDGSKLAEFEEILPPISKADILPGTAPPQQQLDKLLELYNAGRYIAAEQLALSLTQKYPDHELGWKVLAEMLRQKGLLNDALNASERVVQLASHDPEARNNLGVILYQLGRLQEAKQCYEQAVKIRPNYAEAHSNLGVILQEIGKIQDAQASLRKAVNANPEYADAHLYLAALKKYKKQDKQFLKMLELVTGDKVSDTQRSRLHFALAKASEDIGELDQAFGHYCKANELRRMVLKYDIEHDALRFRQLKQTWPKLRSIAIPASDDSPSLVPVFIVGMPRSGTTLVEQIISSHSKVAGAGELFFVSKFGDSLARGESNVCSDSLSRFRGNYLEQLALVSEDRPFVTDKMPQNFCYLGVIAAAFPEAKIIHVKRDPAAVCWANFKQYFESTTLNFTYDLDDIVNYHELYEDLISFWNSQLVGRIYNLDYEALTTNQEQLSRDLISYLDLEWEDGCLSPERNNRSVATASSVQVRQKVYQGSSEQWKKFAPYLEGAFARFDH